MSSPLVTGTTMMASVAMTAAATTTRQMPRTSVMYVVKAVVTTSERFTYQDPRIHHREPPNGWELRCRLTVADYLRHFLQQQRESRLFHACMVKTLQFIESRVRIANQFHHP